MKKIIFLSCLSLVFMGCSGSEVDDIKIVKEDAVDRIEINQGEKTEEQNNLRDDTDVFHIGNRIVFKNQYALTFLSAIETDARNSYSKEDIAQVIEIVYLCENLNMEEDLYISELDFNFIDEKGNMIKTYPLDNRYELVQTTKGARSLGSFHVGAKESSSMIKALYTNNWFSNEVIGEFQIEIGKEVKHDLEGSIPAFHKTYKIGDIIEITSAKGEYTLCIDGIKKTEERNSYSQKDPGEVYIIDYTFSNINMDDPLFISDYDFNLIDEKGMMGCHYPGNINCYPLETFKGARCSAQMTLASHNLNDKLILTYRDNCFSNQADIFISIDLTSK